MTTVIDIDDCPICMEPKDSPMHQLPCCQNELCELCYERLPQRECPFCRKAFEIVELQIPMPAALQPHTPFVSRNYTIYGFGGCCICITITVFLFVSVIFGWQWKIN